MNATIENPTGSTPASPATRTWTSAAEDAAEIRKLLKAHGWTRRHVSVCSESYSMGSSIDVTILAAGIPKATVKEIAERFEHVRYCEVTGEILSGGNRFVTVKFDRDLTETASAEFLPWLDALPVTDSSLATIKVAGQEFHVGRRSSWEYKCFGQTGYVPARDAAGVAYILAVTKLEAATPILSAEQGDLRG